MNNMFKIGKGGADKRKVFSVNNEAWKDERRRKQARMKSI